MTTYTVGQKVCLWQYEVKSKKLVVTREVTVTITETKTGVLGEYSQKPTSHQSLRGIGNDGKEYQKHWDVWPEAQTCGFVDQWTECEDGDDGAFPFWIPVEAVYIYNELRKSGIFPVDKNGNKMFPKGDVIYCEKHDRYHYPARQCFKCFRG